MTEVQGQMNAPKYQMHNESLDPHTFSISFLHNYFLCQPDRTFQLLKTHNSHFALFFELSHKYSNAVFRVVLWDILHRTAYITHLPTHNRHGCYMDFRIQDTS